jgi:hypothetical protein
VTSSSSNFTGRPHDFPHYVEKSGFTVTKTYPKAPSVGVPEHLPDNVSRFFIQAKGWLQRRDFDAAGMMCRKALEATIKENPYYRFVAGDKIAMGEAAQRGYLLFKDPVKATAKLATWASIFTDENYNNIGVGMAAPKPDLGYYAITKLEGHKGEFKTPTLREIASTAPYMHLS